METMKEMNMEACPLSMDAEWCPLVNSRADKAEENRQKQIEQEQTLKEKRMAEEARQRQAAWEEEQKARELTEKRARRFMSAFALALALIVAGGVGLNFIDGFPMWIAISVAVSGMVIYGFVIGWLFGHRARRY